VTSQELTIAGKAPPEPDELADAADRGFEQVELYLEPSHLRDVDETVDIVAAAAVDVVSVHIPHVRLSELEWIHLADELACAFDATLVVHSKYVDAAQIPALERLDLSADYCYENKVTMDEGDVRDAILDPGHGFVLDTAHLYIGEADTQAAMERLFSQYGDQIGVVHCCDSTADEDGLGFGAGTMEMRTVWEIIEDHYGGVVVLEVMPDEQRDALRKVTTEWRQVTATPR
jgi:sugar phosphate isomerase/epimerase